MATRFPIGIAEPNCPFSFIIPMAEALGDSSTLSQQCADMCPGQQHQNIGQFTEFQCHFRRAVTLLCNSSYSFTRTVEHVMGLIPLNSALCNNLWPFFVRVQIPCYKRNKNVSICFLFSMTMYGQNNKTITRTN